MQDLIKFVILSYVSDAPYDKIHLLKNHKISS